jgi:hypothetical protein
LLPLQRAIVESVEEEDAIVNQRWTTVTRKQTRGKGSYNVRFITGSTSYPQLSTLPNPAQDLRQPKVHKHKKTVKVNETTSTKIVPESLTRGSSTMDSGSVTVRVSVEKVDKFSDEEVVGQFMKEVLSELAQGDISNED